MNGSFGSRTTANAKAPATAPARYVTAQRMCPHDVSNGAAHAHMRLMLPMRWAQFMWSHAYESVVCQRCASMAAREHGASHVSMGWGRLTRSFCHANV